ncbi:MAG TPA: hypothetical protein VMM13_08280 [Euzebya sp.]|nr:hypothetical protein [Euzebya sp.]
MGFSDAQQVRSCTPQLREEGQTDPERHEAEHQENGRPLHERHGERDLLADEQLLTSIGIWSHRH